MQRDLLQSTGLKSAGYNEEDEILEIEFTDGSIHQYLRVPPEKYTGLVTSDSHSSYFAHNIRGLYEYKEVETPSIPSPEV